MAIAALMGAIAFDPLGSLSTELRFSICDNFLAFLPSDFISFLAFFFLSQVLFFDLFDSLAVHHSALVAHLTAVSTAKILVEERTWDTIVSFTAFRTFATLALDLLFNFI